MKYNLYFLIVLLGAVFYFPVYAEEAALDVQDLTTKAEHWDRVAQYQLSVLYILGDGVKVDAGKAMFWKLLSEQVALPAPDLMSLQMSEKAREAHRKLEGAAEKSPIMDVMTQTDDWRLQHLNDLKDVLKERYANQPEKKLITDYRYIASPTYPNNQPDSPCKENTHSMDIDAGAIFWCSDNSGQITWINVKLGKKFSH